jgi:hypothetical protein
LESGGELHAELVASGDAHEGLSGVVEKRKAQFSNTGERQPFAVSKSSATV